MVRSLIDSLVVYLLRSMEFSLEIYILIFYALLCEFSLDLRLFSLVFDFVLLIISLILNLSAVMKFLRVSIDGA